LGVDPLGVKEHFERPRVCHFIVDQYSDLLRDFTILLKQSFELTGHIRGVFNLTNHPLLVSLVIHFLSHLLKLEQGLEKGSVATIEAPGRLIRVGKIRVAVVEDLPKWLGFDHGQVVSSG